MSTVVSRVPVVVAGRPPRGWSIRSLYRGWRTRRKARPPIYVAIMHAADLPPGSC